MTALPSVIVFENVRAFATPADAADPWMFVVPLLFVRSPVPLLPDLRTGRTYVFTLPFVRMAVIHRQARAGAKEGDHCRARDFLKCGVTKEEIARVKFRDFCRGF
jgi:hypothetical protein